MRITDQSASGRSSTPFARVLACLLLAGIVYSATFGALHSHTQVLSNQDTSLFERASEQVSVSAETPVRSRSNGTECLICSFHRQFSSSTVHTPLFIVGHSAQVAFAPAPTNFYYTSLTVSRPITRLSGRAPPLRQV
jgi:hypothetical protein